MLLPVLAGYWFLSHTHVLKRAYNDKSNYELFFASAISGAVFLFLAWPVAIGLEYIAGRNAWLGWFGQKWGEFVPFRHSGAITVATCMAIASSVITNARIPDKEAAARWAAETESRMGWILRESLEQRRLVEVSLTNGKSYVGFVLEEDPGGWEQDLALLPVLSGYRNARTKRLVLTKNYAAAGPPALKNFGVVVPVKEVVSVCRFDVAVHQTVASRGTRSAA